MGKRIKAIDDILGNKTSGSMDLAEQLNKFMAENTSNPDAVRKAIQEVKKSGSSFQAVNTYLKELKRILKSGDETNLKSFFKIYRQNSITKYKKIYDNAKNLLRNKNLVLTISNSRTVLEFMKLWHRENKNLQVIISESRPMNEGRILAKSLLQEGIKVIFITDFNISKHISQADAVITGADFILKNGDAVNKTGSRTAAIICKFYKKPFYVLASSDKFSNRNSYKPHAENPNEVWKYMHKNLKIINNYFEVIEKKLITKIISEEK